jgi:hypothetical protein
LTLKDKKNNQEYRWNKNLKKKVRGTTPGLTNKPINQSHVVGEIENKTLFIVGPSFAVGPTYFV